LQRLVHAHARRQDAELEKEIDKQVDDRILELEAVARRATPDALIAALPRPDVSESDLHAFYDEERPEQPFDTLRPKIRQYLERQQAEETRARFLMSLREKYHVEWRWEPMREAVSATGPERGPGSARVTIVEFADFQCPYCRRLAQTLRSLQAAYPTQVKLVYRYMPLRSVHPDAGRAAEAAACADLQGKFWEMHDALYADQSALGAEAIKATARRLKLDDARFDTCLDGGQTAARVKSDEDAALALGLTTTPSAFVDGRFRSGALPLYEWEALVESELARELSTVPR
jgi:predicted DsbA family dithiol-disulfide isomerase